MSTTVEPLEATLKEINLELEIAETGVKKWEKRKLELQHRRKSIYEQLAEEDPEGIFVSLDSTGEPIKTKRLMALVYYVIRNSEVPLWPDGVHSHIPGEEYETVRVQISNLLEYGYIDMVHDRSLQVQRNE